MIYRILIRPLLYTLQPESAHRLAVALLRFLQAMPGGLFLLRLLFRLPALSPVQALGLSFPSPIGLAAGFDKDAEIYAALGAMGFGFVEVGTITKEGQGGNPQPRLFRLVEDQALINRMGFNNHGSAHAAKELAKSRDRTRDPILGINIGKTKLTPSSEAVADYEASTRRLAPYADYFVVNVSSPNTPGLRDLQATSSLRPILQAVRQALDETVQDRRIPLLVKIAPDLADEDIRELGQMALDIALDGIIATNTTISREGLHSDPKQVSACGAGGLSGAPLKARALEVLRLLRSEVGADFVLIAAGGIDNAADVVDRLRAGAQLVQIYTALIYQGPALPSRLAKELHQR